MRPIRQWVRWAGAAAVLVAAAGCGSNAVYPVKGTITFDGKPLKGGGAISFVPLGKQAGKAAGGEIKDDGTYELMTHKPGDGSMTGEFRVVIHQTTDREPEPTRDGERPGKAVSVVAAADRIPAIYSDATNSPLRATVEAKTPNEINFDLKRDAGPPAVKGAMKDNPLRDTFAELSRPWSPAGPD